MNIIFFNPKHKIIKIIAAIVCVCFLWQDVGWAADGDFLRQAQFAHQGQGRQNQAAVSVNAVGGRGKNWIIMPDGARVHKTASVDTDCVIEGKKTVIGPRAIIKGCSIISNATVNAGAYIESSIIKTTDNTDKWRYKKGSDIMVKSRRPVSIGKGAKVIKSVIYSSRLGNNTEIYESTIEHSDIGEENHFEKAKVCLAKTMQKVWVTWAEVSEGIFGFGFRYDGLALGGPAYFEGVYSNRFSVATILHKDLSKMTEEEVNGIISDPEKLQAFVKGIKFKSIKSIPHVSQYMPYVIYSVFTGKNLPPENGVLKSIKGEDGEQLSQHARIAIDPVIAIAAGTDVSPRIIGRPDPRRPKKTLKTQEFTHQSCFSLSGFNGPMVHGQIRPGAESHSLSPSRIQHLWAFTHTPSLVFELMAKISDFLPEGEKDKFDDLPIRAIETAFLMTLSDLNRIKTDIETAIDSGDQARVASLRKLERNLTDALPIYIRNLRADKEFKLWHFKNGKPSGSWHQDETGRWINDNVSLSFLSCEKEDEYKQYSVNEALEHDNVQKRQKPASVLSKRDLLVITGKAKMGGRPKVEAAETAQIGKNVRFFGNGNVKIGPDARLENCLIVSNGETIISESANLSLVRLEASGGKTISVGAGVMLDYSNIKDSTIGMATKGCYVRISEGSQIGECNELNPFADICDTKTSSRNIIGHVIKHSTIARGFISRHIPTEIYYLETPPTIIRVGDKEYEMANPINIGAGAHIIGEEGHPVTIAWGGFIGSNAIIKPGAIINASFILGEVPRDKEILPLTFFDSHSGTELLGELLKEKWAAVPFRTFIYRGKMFTPVADKWVGDYFMTSLIDILEEKIKSSAARPNYSAEQLDSTLALLETVRQDGRWVMENHRFKNGVYGYDGQADSWKWYTRSELTETAAEVGKIANSIGSAKIPTYDGTRPIEDVLQGV